MKWDTYPWIDVFEHHRELISHGRWYLGTIGNIEIEINKVVGAHFQSQHVWDYPGLLHAEGKTSPICVS